MKFKRMKWLLSLVLASGLVFWLSADAQAHEYDGYTHDENINISAKDVGVDSEEDVRTFLSHAVNHFNQIYLDDTLSREQKNIKLVIFNRAARVEGVFKHAGTDMYTLGVSSRGVITSHAGYPGLFGHEVDFDAAGSDTAAVLKKLNDAKTTETAHCETYQDRGGGSSRVACARTIRAIESGAGGTIKLVAGLHHAEEDSAIGLPDCSRFRLETTAKHVYENQTLDNLEAYVKGVIKAFQEMMSRMVTDVIAERGGVQALAPLRTATPAEQKKFLQGLVEDTGLRVFDNIACFGSGDMRHGNIYPFIMGSDEKGTVILNGNNFDLAGLDLQVNDETLEGDDKSIAGLFRRKLDENKTATPVTATPVYRWDDPTTDEDDNEGWLEKGIVPGSSTKTSYIEVASMYGLVEPPLDAIFEGFPEHIFGSGIYNLKDDTGSDGGDGCAIATGDAAPQGALFNLLLAGAVLFSAVFLRRRV